MRVVFQKEEGLTFCNCGDRGFGFQRLQRKKRSKSAVKGDTSRGVEKLLL